MKRLFFLLIFSLVFYQSLPLFSCTGVVVSNDELTLVGNNEDYPDPLTKVWFIPSKDGKYGCVFFGYEDYSPQGGMNDKGLFFDGFSAPPLKVTGSVHKEMYKGNLIEKVMYECTTVKEVIAVFDKYNREFLDRAMYFFADKSGDSVIIEGDEFVRKKGRYQIVTNFRQSKATPGVYPCWRYNAAIKILDESDEVSVDLCRRILEATHANQKILKTLYSNVYDLKNGIIHLYYFHDFTKKVTFDLKKELAKGEHFYDLPSLFPKNPSAEAFKKKILAARNKWIADRRWNKADPRAFKTFTGYYQHDRYPFEKYYIYEENNKLFSRPLTAPEAQELIACSKESFYINCFPGNLKITFQKNESGFVTGAFIEEDGRDLKHNMRKLPPSEEPYR